MVMTLGYGLDKKNEACVWLKLTRQYSWDAQRKSASFKENFENPQANVNVKLNITEIASLISAFRNGMGLGEKGLFHSSPNGTVAIRLNFSSTETASGWFLSINRNHNDEFKIPLSLGDGEHIRIFLETGLMAYYGAGLRESFTKKTSEQNYISKRNTENYSQNNFPAKTYQSAPKNAFSPKARPQQSQNVADDLDDPFGGEGVINDAPSANTNVMENSDDDYGDPFA
jgi:hypothetical protein